MVKKLLYIALYVLASFGLFVLGAFVALKLGWTKTSGIVDDQHDYFKQQMANDLSWTQSEEWPPLKAAIKKDEADIGRAAMTADISPRLIIAPLIVEQLRLFTSDRELFKKVFSPLEILGVQSQYSWGVMGLKQDTAKKIEQGLSDNQSPFYLGKKYEHLLDFTSADHDSERFNRLTDDESRYYSYLYAALYEKELIAQWRTSGIDISNRPEIISTLFNIGFDNSKPHLDPLAGGAKIDVNGHKYSFGSLALSFFQSDELTEFH